MTRRQAAVVVRRRLGFGALGLVVLGVAPVASSTSSEDWRPILNATGEVVAHRRFEEAGARVRSIDAAEFEVPGYQLWHASGDGRTLVGVGEPGAPEHPREVHFQVWRDGAEVLSSTNALDPESTFSVGAAGHVAVVGHPVGDRERWNATVYGPAGGELWSQELPGVLVAGDPALFGEGLLLRASYADPANDDAVLFLTASGTHSVVTFSTVQQVVGYESAGKALVRTSASLSWIDVPSRTVVWQVPVSVRPAGQHAWTLTDSPAGTRLAVVASGLRRAGQPTPLTTLLTLDARDGTLLERIPLEAQGPPALARLTRRPGGATLDWMGVKEVFSWTR